MNYKVLVAALLAAAVVHAETLDPLPVGWAPMGRGGPLQVAGDCEAGIDGALAAAGQPNLSIRCANDVPSFGGHYQSFEANPYWGKRVRFSGWIKADGIEGVDGVEGGAGLWIVVPTQDGRMVDRMADRAVKGWTSWEYREFVVEVPDEGGAWMLIGFWAQGRGQMWVRDLNFEIVGDSVPVNLAPETDVAPGPNLTLE
ncbi:MAG: hypothetical protein ACWGPN_15730 [Gammaproteobacteria bacterium]